MKISEQKEYHRLMHHREPLVVENGMTDLWEWVCEMQGELVVACAVASALSEEDIG